MTPLKTTPLTARELDRLRQMRFQHGWSFREMASLIGMKTPTLQKILNGGVDESRETTVYRIRQWLASQTSQKVAV
jgi:transcriptional regulator with XRE-family HTH domain